MEWFVSCGTIYIYELWIFWFNLWFSAYTSHHPTKGEADATTTNKLIWLIHRTVWRRRCNKLNESTDNTASAHCIQKHLAAKFRHFMINFMFMILLTRRCRLSLLIKLLKFQPLLSTTGVVLKLCLTSRASNKSSSNPTPIPHRPKIHHFYGIIKELFLVYTEVLQSLPAMSPGLKWLMNIAISGSDKLSYWCLIAHLTVLCILLIHTASWTAAVLYFISWPF